MEFRHYRSLNATIFESVDKMDFPTFRGNFGTLNATICWSTLHKLLTIEKYDVSALTGKKLMSADKNSSKTKEIKFETFPFFQKKINIFSKKNQHFFKFWKSPEKTAPGAVFFEKFIQLQNCLESLQIIFRTFWRYRWKGLTSHLTILKL